MLYEVIVGNIGTVYSGEDHAAAEAAYNRYSEMADISPGSRCYGETITLIVDGEISSEHHGTMDAD